VKRRQNTRQLTKSRAINAEESEENYERVKLQAHINCPNSFHSFANVEQFTPTPDNKRKVQTALCVSTILVMRRNKKR
jgi:hypothetical protein